MNTIGVLLKVFGVYSLFLTIFGTITNLISVFICLRRKLKTNPTFIFLSFMLCSDSVALYQYNLDGFYKPFHDGIILEHLSDVWCTISAPLQIFTLHASVWFLVAISIERLLCIKIKHWRQKWFDARRAIYVSILILIVSFIISFPVMFSGRLIPNPGNSSDPNQDRMKTPIDRVCFYDDILTTVFWISNFTYSVIPFITLLIVNCALIRVITNDRILTSRPNQENMKRRQLSISIIVITFVFMFLTLPNIIVTTLFLESLSSSIRGSLVLLIFSSIGFTYHSSHFIVLIVTNKCFLNELKHVFKSFTVSNRIHHIANANMISVIRNIHNRE